MPSLATLICFVLLAATCGGLYLWWKSSDNPHHDEDRAAPDVYTSENVCPGVSYHVEQNGVIQDFDVISVHWSGYFLIEVAPDDGHELDRDHVRLNGWTRELPSNRLIEARHLLELLPSEIRFAPRYN